MRFRLGCWELEVNRPNGRERAARTCRLCATGAVEDELRVLWSAERAWLSETQHAHHYG